MKMKLVWVVPLGNGGNPKPHNPKQPRFYFDGEVGVGKAGIVAKLGIVVKFLKMIVVTIIEPTMTQTLGQYQT